jgi:hypothetical protein
MSGEHGTGAGAGAGNYYILGKMAGKFAKFF